MLPQRPSPRPRRRLRRTPWRATMRRKKQGGAETRDFDIFDETENPIADADDEDDEEVRAAHAQLPAYPLYAGDFRQLNILCGLAMQTGSPSAPSAPSAPSGNSSPLPDSSDSGGAFEVEGGGEAGRERGGQKWAPQAVVLAAVCVLALLGFCIPQSYFTVMVNMEVANMVTIIAACACVYMLAVMAFGVSRCALASVQRQRAQPSFLLILLLTLWVHAQCLGISKRVIAVDAGFRVLDPARHISSRQLSRRDHLRRMPRRARRLSVRSNCRRDAAELC